MKNIFTFLTVLALFMSVSMLSSTQTHAQLGGGGGGGGGGATGIPPTGIVNPVIGKLGDNPTEASEGNTFAKYFVFVWQALISVGSIAMLGYFLWAAIDWIVAGGDSGKIQKARDKMTNAVIGMVLLVGSFAIIGFIGSVFFGDDFNVLAPTFLDPLITSTHVIESKA